MRFLNFFGISIYLLIFLISTAAEGKDYSVPFYYWNPTVSDISATGATVPQAAINASGQIATVWVRSNLIKASSSSDNNATWSTISTLSSTGDVAASEPQIALNASNQTIAVWSLLNIALVSTNIQSAYSSDGGANWNAAVDIYVPEPVPLTTAGVPQIALNTSGNAIVVFYNNDPNVAFNTIIRAAYSTDGGDWTLVNLSADGQNASAPQVALNDSGQAIAVWQRSDGANTIIQAAYSINSGVSWPAITSLSAAGQSAGTPQIALNASGQAIAIWERSDGTNTIIQASYSSDGGANWNSPISLSTTGQNATVSQISLNASNQAVAVWQRSDGSNTIIQAAYSTNGGVSWSTPVNLSVAGQNATIPQISLNDSNWALATWSRSDGSNTIIQSSYSLDRGQNWSANLNLSAAGTNADNPQVSLNASGRSVFPWVRGVIQVANGYNTAVAVTAVQNTVRFPLTKDLVNQMTWSTMSEVSSFKVYGNAGLTESLSYYSVGSTFSDHQRKRGLDNYYYFTVIANNLESPSVKMTLP